MIRGTTPTFIFTIGESLDLSKITSVYTTFKSLSKKVIVEPERCIIDINEHTVSVTLTQEETLLLEVPNAKVQLRFYNSEDKLSYASHILTVAVEPVLQEGVIDE